jgi:hypothetical protein
MVWQLFDRQVTAHCCVVPHVPLDVHVCCPVPPEQIVALGAQTPVHAPLTQA